MLRREKKKPKKFLSDKIADLLTVAPADDVEDDQVFKTKPKTVTREDLDSDGDSVEETALSDFRKRNASLLAEISDRYAGEVTSKKDLGLVESDQESVEVESDDLVIDTDQAEEETDNESEKDLQEGDETYDKTDKDEEEQSEEEDETDSEEMEGSEEGLDLSQLEGDKITEDNFKHFKQKNIPEEVEKGLCVKNQLNLWEGLLEMRICMQKCLATANRMPLQDTLKELKSQGGDEFNILLNKTKGSSVTLLSRLLELQKTLISQYPETKTLLDKSSTQSQAEEDPMDEEISSDEEIPSDEEIDEKPTTAETPSTNGNTGSQNRKRKLADFSAELADRHITYSKYRNSVIQKWNEKTKVMGMKKDQPATVSVLSQIEYILSDKNKLVRRTQLKRSKYDILGQTKADEENETSNEICDKPEDVDRRNLDDEYCTEIFDDDDFYHQLLRELIEYKSADISDPIQLSRQWIMLQQIRSKMKRKVDTRATKGRRIRYAVHSKLVNFMAPEASTEWTDDMKNELYASLFGKQYENQISHNKSESNGGFEILKA